MLDRHLPWQSITQAHQIFFKQSIDLKLEQVKSEADQINALHSISQGTDFVK